MYRVLMKVKLKLTDAEAQLILDLRESVAHRRGELEGFRTAFNYAPEDKREVLKSLFDSVVNRVYKVTLKDLDERR